MHHNNFYQYHFQITLSDQEIPLIEKSMFPHNKVIKYRSLREPSSIPISQWKPDQYTTSQNHIISQWSVTKMITKWRLGCRDHNMLFVDRADLQSRKPINAHRWYDVNLTTSDQSQAANGLDSNPQIKPK